MLGEQDAVIKSITENYRNVAGITGASILGDGRVSLILDVTALIQMAAARPAAASPLTPWRVPRGAGEANASNTGGTNMTRSNGSGLETRTPGTVLRLGDPRRLGGHVPLDRRADHLDLRRSPRNRRGRRLRGTETERPAFDDGRADPGGRGRRADDPHVRQRRRPPIGRIPVGKTDRQRVGMESPGEVGAAGDGQYPGLCRT